MTGMSSRIMIGMLRDGVLFESLGELSKRPKT
jgi:amino acid transporter